MRILQLVMTSELTLILFTEAQVELNHFDAILFGKVLYEKKTLKYSLFLYHYLRNLFQVQAGGKFLMILC
jgi:hypothetical protein